MTELPDDDDIICMDTIKPRKIKPQNIVCRILSRERGYVIMNNVRKSKQFSKVRMIARFYFFIAFYRENGVALSENFTKIFIQI